MDKELTAFLEGMENRLTSRIDSIDQRMESMEHRMDSIDRTLVEIKRTTQQTHPSSNCNHIHGLASTYNKTP